MDSKERIGWNNLIALSKKAHLFSGIERLLGWDQETVMPINASEIRAEQRALLAECSHALATGSEYEKLLFSLIDRESGAVLMESASPQERAALREMRRDFLRLKKLPDSFVAEFTAVTAQSTFHWDEAKKTNSFAHFEPYFSKVLDLSRKKAELIGYKEHPYDALLDEYEPHMTTKELDVLFTELMNKLPPLLHQILAKKKEKAPEPIMLTVEEGKLLADKLLELVNFDHTRGRVDLSSHPFSSAYHPDDSRLTIRNVPQPLTYGTLTTLHEYGHSLYEMNLPKEQYGTPLCEAVSYGIHESQSRTWETRIASSLPFWQFLTPIVQKLFPKKCAHVTPELLYKEIATVEPGFIRTDADEVTYPLHIVLRFRLEKELLEGSLKIKDVPERWRKEMKTLLGLVPERDDIGCLQDIHWSMGAFAYFPSYTLGNMYAASFFNAFEKEHSDWESRVTKGDFAFIQNWYKQNIHSHGRQYSAKELVQRITGEPFSAEPYIQYLTKKYI